MRKLWLSLLAAWFLLWGLLAITNLQFQHSGFILGLLAIAVGVLALLDR